MVDFVELVELADLVDMVYLVYLVALGDFFVIKCNFETKSTKSELTMSTF